MVNNPAERRGKFHGIPERYALQSFLVKELPVLQVCHQCRSAFVAQVSIWQVTTSTTNGQGKSQSICTLFSEATGEFVEAQHGCHRIGR
jgi:hypothetical protein